MEKENGNDANQRRPFKTKKGAKILAPFSDWFPFCLWLETTKKRQLRHYKRVERQESNKDEDDDQEFHPARILQMHRRDDLHLKRKKKGGFWEQACSLTVVIYRRYIPSSSQCARTQCDDSNIIKGKLTSSLSWSISNGVYTGIIKKKLIMKGGGETREEKFKKIVGWVCRFWPFSPDHPPTQGRH